MDILYFELHLRDRGRQSCCMRAESLAERAAWLTIWVMTFRQSLPLFRNGKLKKSLADYTAFRCTGDRPAHWALLYVVGMEVFGDCRERSHHVREQLKSKRWKQSWTDLQASSSMCADSLRGGLCPGFRFITTALQNQTFLRFGKLADAGSGNRYHPVNLQLLWIRCKFMQTLQHS